MISWMHQLIIVSTSWLKKRTERKKERNCGGIFTFQITDLVHLQKIEISDVLCDEDKSLEVHKNTNSMRVHFLLF